MKIIDHRGEIELSGVSDFSIEKTLECGQCFRWESESSGAYTGVAFGRKVRLRNQGCSIFITCSIEDFEAVWRSYFDLDRNYGEIRRKLSIDRFMQCATVFGAGIRILKQDRWEALCSFILSQNNNIPRIKKIIDTLCREFGEACYFENKLYSTFPSVATLALLDVEHLAPLRCGYRAAYIINAAKMINNNSLDLDALSYYTPEKARTELIKLHGIGDKVANCVLLYGLHMLDVFPLDVWMKRALAQFFKPDFDPVVFSPYAGIAQQYIYHFIRNYTERPHVT